MSQPFTIFMVVKTTASWLAKPPAARFAFFDDAIKPILAAHPEVTLRYFDVEAFSGEATDVLMWETRDLTRYQSLVENLRETPFWDDYFLIKFILPGIENAYAAHYKVEVLGQAAQA
jgi:hypothetical protein